MRLSPDQRKDFITVTHNLAKDFPFKLYLYGSRIHDHLKGGDIDLLLLTNEDGKNHFQALHLDLLVGFKKKKSIGDRRIDLKISTQRELDTIPFLKSIKSDLVEL